jgi:hypothetical protein
MPFGMFKKIGRTGTECDHQLLNYADDVIGQIYKYCHVFMTRHGVWIGNWIS